MSLVHTSLAVAAIVGAALPAAAAAAESASPAALIPRAALFDNPSKSGGQVSPDGKWVSWLAPVDGVMNIWVAPIDQPQAGKPVTTSSERPIRTYYWAPDSAGLLYLQDRGGDENFLLYGVDPVTGTERALTPFDKTRVRVVGVSTRVRDSILVALNNRDRRWHDLHRLNLKTGELTEVLRNDGEFSNFTVDEDLTPRLAARTNDDGGHDMHRIVGGKVEDKPFTRTTLEDSLTTRPHGFASDGKTLFWRDSRGRNTAALLAQDFASGQTRLIAQDPRADIGDTLRHPQTGAIQAYSVEYLRDEWTVLDPRIAKTFKLLKRKLKGDFLVTSRSDDDTKWVISEDPITASPRAWLLDRKAGKLTALYTTRPALEGMPLQSQQAVEIKARDGLVLPSYLTLPPGSDSNADGIPDRPVPMVLYVHGGPWNRDSYGFDRGFQLLANRGYAVLSVNFRGSTGFGKNFISAANKQWGRKMQDDLIDAVDWAVARGVAREDKVAILGGSYGGYATLAALAFTPTKFACGVDVVGPSNIETLLKAVPPYWVAQRQQFAQRVGDWTTPDGLAMLRERSPLNSADKIVRPLLIGQGANDPRVNQGESDQIVAAMKAKGIPVTYVLFPDEGHGFAKPRNNIAFNAVAENFLATCLGGRAEPIGEAIRNSSAKVPEGAAIIPGLTEALKR